MAVTIFEALQNARYNLKTTANSSLKEFLVALATEQLHNAVTLLEKGYDLETEITNLLDKYGAVEDVPKCEKS